MDCAEYLRSEAASALRNRKLPRRTVIVAFARALTENLTKTAQRACGVQRRNSLWNCIFSNVGESHEQAFSLPALSDHRFEVRRAERC